jgi:Tol biopolymer transport system component
MRYSARIPLVASLIAIAACEQPGSVTGPVSGRGAPPDALASKQGTTSSQMLIELIGATIDIGRVEDDGTNLVALASSVAREASPAWAPDGKRIVFESDAYTPPYASLYAMNEDGTGVTRLTFPPAGYSDEMPVGFAAGIVFWRFDAAHLESAIFLLSSDGGLTQLTSGPADVGPAPSPKGKSIAFIRNADIYVLDLDSGGLTNVTNTPGCIELWAAYSPSGKQIAFSRNNCGEIPGGIFVMNSDGTSVTRLTTNANLSTDEQPRWSPDGKRIGFTRSSGGVSAIYVMSADGTNLIQLPLDPTVGYAYVLSAWARY